MVVSKFIIKQAQETSTNKSRAVYKLLAACALGSFLVLSGCREVLYSNLTEEDANELTAVLLERNIEAVKVNAGKTGFNVEVESADFVNAIKIAKDHSLPRNQFDSLGSIFTGQSMIATQTEERSRLSYAISQELCSTLESIDGVIKARVHIVLSEYDQMSGRTTMPSASVFLRHTKDSPVVNMLVGIKETVSKAVPGLEISNVAVMTEAFVPNVYTPAPKPTFNMMHIALAMVGGILVLLGAIGAFMYSRGYRLTSIKAKAKAKDKSGEDSQEVVTKEEPNEEKDSSE